MRAVFTMLMGLGLLAGGLGCCLHDTCDCCTDICSSCHSCCSNGGYYVAPGAGPAVKVEEIKKLPAPKTADAPPPKVGEE